MDGIEIVRTYIDKMIDRVEGMKVLILDAHTTQIVSSVYSQTEILQRGVYLVRSLAASSDMISSSQKHLQAILFCRPTSLEEILPEIQQNRYSGYSIFFSAKVETKALRQLAEADQEEVIMHVAEYYADFIPVNRDLWSLHARRSLAMTVAAGTSWAIQHGSTFERHVMGIASMLQALKCSAATIRYAKHSAAAEEMARDLVESLDDTTFYSQKQQHPMTVLILDRRDDPVTPLLSQWTYQAMVHELLGLNNHRVSLRGAPDIAKDLEEVVLSDDFFETHKFKNFGELGEEIQRLLQEYQSQTKHTTTALNTVADMQNFMDKFPELRSRQHTVSKHVAIMGELARLVETCRLLDVSVLEQNLACHDDHSTHWRDLLSKLNDDSIKVPDKLRLGMLYALRYENIANLHMLLQAMSKGGVTPPMIQLVKSLLRYGGTKSRGPGLFHGDGDIMSRVTKNLVGAVQGIENVYSQHEPLLMYTLQNLLKGKLSTREYPVASGNVSEHNNDVLIFMVGGITYEEAYKIAEFNKTSRVKIVLAGSTVHNSTSFLDELKSAGL